MLSLPQPPHPTLRFCHRRRGRHQQPPPASDLRPLPPAVYASARVSCLLACVRGNRLVRSVYRCLIRFFKFWFQYSFNSSLNLIFGSIQEWFPIFCGPFSLSLRWHGLKLASKNDINNTSLQISHLTARNSQWNSMVILFRDRNHYLYQRKKGDWKRAFI